MKTVKLSSLSNMARRVAEASIRENGEYHCEINGERVEVVEDDLFGVYVSLYQNGEEIDRYRIVLVENEGSARSVMAAVSCAIEETGLDFVEAVLHWIADGRKPETRPIGL